MTYQVSYLTLHPVHQQNFYVLFCHKKKLSKEKHNIRTHHIFFTIHYDNTNWHIQMLTNILWILFPPSKNYMTFFLSCRKSFCVHNFSLKFIDENSFKIAIIGKDGVNFIARDGRGDKVFFFILCGNLHTQMSWFAYVLNEFFCMMNF